MAKTELNLTPEQIAGIVGATVGDVNSNWPAIEQALAGRGMTHPLVKVAAIATIGTEVGNTFRPINEYGDRAYFTRMYENRADLGNTRKGDGARYHGRGYIQLTGRTNYAGYGAKLGLPLEAKPELALTPDVAAAVLADYFKDRGVDTSAVKRDWESVRRKVNGGLNGWARFKDLVTKLLTASGLDKPSPRVPAARPASRILTLTSPYTAGPDVAAAQRALGVPDDGEYGPVTASAVSAWKRASGYPETEIDTTLEPDDMRRLLGRKPLPPAYARRAQARARETAPAGPVTELAVAEMEAWAGAKYAEKPPGRNTVPQLVRLARELGVAPGNAKMGFPWCAFSAFLAALKHGGTTADAGLRKLRFNALYCPTILSEAQAGRHGMRVIPQSQAARGDLVLFDWAPGGDPSDHVGRLARPPAGGMVATVDGNSGPEDLWVILRERPLNLVRAFVRDS
jgi:predicted chitinase